MRLASGPGTAVRRTGPSGSPGKVVLAAKHLKGSGESADYNGLVGAKKGRPDKLSLDKNISIRFVRKRQL